MRLDWQPLAMVLAMQWDNGERVRKRRVTIGFDQERRLALGFWIKRLRFDWI